MGKGALLTIWIVASLAWIAVAAYLCLGSWPRLPIDMILQIPRPGPASMVRIRGHVMRYALLGVLPPLAVFLFGRLAGTFGGADHCLWTRVPPISDCPLQSGAVALKASLC